MKELESFQTHCYVFDMFDEPIEMEVEYIYNPPIIPQRDKRGMPLEVQQDGQIEVQSIYNFAMEEYIPFDKFSEDDKERIIEECHNHYNNN